MPTYKFSTTGNILHRSTLSTSPLEVRNKEAKIVYAKEAFELEKANASAKTRREIEQLEEELTNFSFFSKLFNTTAYQATTSALAAKIAEKNLLELQALLQHKLTIKLLEEKKTSINWGNADSAEINTEKRMVIDFVQKREARIASLRKKINSFGFFDKYIFKRQEVTSLQGKLAKLTDASLRAKAEEKVIDDATKQMTTQIRADAEKQLLKITKLMQVDKDKEKNDTFDFSEGKIKYLKSTDTLVDSILSELVRASNIRIKDKLYTRDVDLPEHLNGRLELLGLNKEQLLAISVLNNGNTENFAKLFVPKNPEQNILCPFAAAATRQEFSKEDENNFTYTIEEVGVSLVMDDQYIFIGKDGQEIQTTSSSYFYKNSDGEYVDLGPEGSIASNSLDHPMKNYPIELYIIDPKNEYKYIEIQPAITRRSTSHVQIAGDSLVISNTAEITHNSTLFVPKDEVGYSKAVSINPASSANYSLDLTRVVSFDKENPSSFSISPMQAKNIIHDELAETSISSLEEILCNEKLTGTYERDLPRTKVILDGQIINDPRLGRTFEAAELSEKLGTAGSQATMAQIIARAMNQQLGTDVTIPVDKDIYENLGLIPTDLRYATDKTISKTGDAYSVEFTANKVLFNNTAGKLYYITPDNTMASIDEGSLSGTSPSLKRENGKTFISYLEHGHPKQVECIVPITTSVKLTATPISDTEYQFEENLDFTYNVDFSQVKLPAELQKELGDKFAAYKNFATEINEKKAALTSTPAPTAAEPEKRKSPQRLGPPYGLKDTMPKAKVEATKDTPKDTLERKPPKLSR